MHEPLHITVNYETAQPVLVPVSFHASRHAVMTGT